MSWSSTMMIPLRVLINDMDPIAYTHTDETLEQLLATAAQYVIQEVKFTTAYTVCFNVVDISPDPSADMPFMNLVVMKAACLTNQWEFNANAIKQDVKAKCGPVKMEIGSPSSLILLALINGGFCESYKEMKNQHNFGNAFNIRAVLTPFSHSDHDIGVGSEIIRGIN